MTPQCHVTIWLKIDIFLSVLIRLCNNYVGGQIPMPPHTNFTVIFLFLLRQLVICDTVLLILTYSTKKWTSTSSYNEIPIK